MPKEINLEIVKIIFEQMPNVYDCVIDKWKESVNIIDDVRAYREALVDPVYAARMAAGVATGGVKRDYLFKIELLSQLLPSDLRSTKTDDLDMALKIVGRRQKIE